MANAGMVYMADGETFVMYATKSISKTVEELEKYCGEPLTYHRDEDTWICKLYNVYSKNTHELKFMITVY